MEWPIASGAEHRVTVSAETPVLGGLSHELLCELLEWLGPLDLVRCGSASRGTSKKLDGGNRLAIVSPRTLTV